MKESHTEDIEEIHMEESDHNYVPSVKLEKKICIPGAEKLCLRFDTRSKLEVRFHCRIVDRYICLLRIFERMVILSVYMETKTRME